MRTPGLLQAMGLAIPYLSVIAPMAIYQVLQDIASVEGANSAGDNYDARLVVACDGLGTFLCGAAGSIITPVVAALHPPYKMMGARIGFCFWTAIIFLAVFMSGISLFMAQLFPWAILAAMIAYVAIGVGRATLHHVDHKYINAVLLGLVLPAGAVVSSAVSSALPALKLSAANPEVQAALNRSIYWNSIQGLGNGFLFLVLVVSALITEMIDRNFGRAAIVVPDRRRLLLVRTDALPDYALGRAAHVRRRLAGRGVHRLLSPLVARRSGVALAFRRASARESKMPA